MIEVLKSSGFTIVQTFSNHLLVDATGPNGSVEQLFSTQTHNALQAGNAVYIHETAITIPASLASYTSGVILDNMVNRFYSPQTMTLR